MKYGFALALLFFTLTPAFGQIENRTLQVSELAAAEAAVVREDWQAVLRHLDAAASHGATDRELDERRAAAHIQLDDNIAAFAIYHRMCQASAHDSEPADMRRMLSHLVTGDSRLAVGTPYEDVAGLLGIPDELEDRSPIKRVVYGDGLKLDFLDGRLLEQVSLTKKDTKDRGPHFGIIETLELGGVTWRVQSRIRLGDMTDMSLQAVQTNDTIPQGTTLKIRFSLSGGLTFDQQIERARKADLLLDPKSSLRVIARGPQDRCYESATTMFIKPRYTMTRLRAQDGFQFNMSLAVNQQQLVGSQRQAWITTLFSKEAGDFLNELATSAKEYGNTNIKRDET